MENLHFGWQCNALQTILIKITKVVLPQLFLLFQRNPFYIPQPYFKQLDSIILALLWNYKAVHIVKKHCKPKLEGGFGLLLF